MNVYDCTIHEVGALLKNMLRNVPGGILLSSRYTEFVATNDLKDVQTRVQYIQKCVILLYYTVCTYCLISLGFLSM